MSRNGNRNDPISRVRSRRNLSRSRAAMAAMALSSFIGKNPEIDIVEARLPRPQHGERCLELAHEVVRRPAIEGDMEPSVFVEGHVEPHELAPQRYPVRSVKLQRLPAALHPNLARRSLRHHLTMVENQDVVGGLRFLQVMGS